MSGYADSEILRAAAHGVLQNHIQKPFTVESLLSRVAEALPARWHGGDRLRVPQFPSP